PAVSAPIPPALPRPGPLHIIISVLLLIIAQTCRKDLTHGTDNSTNYKVCSYSIWERERERESVWKTRNGHRDETLLHVDIPCSVSLPQDYCEQDRLSLVKDVFCISVSLPW